MSAGAGQRGGAGWGPEALIALSAALATRREDLIRRALARAADEAASAEVEEVILQSHLFLGFPDALNGLAAWRELAGDAARPPAADDEALWEERGQRICATVYGANYERLRANVAALHPDLDRWMVVGGYGRVIGRPGLELATRELCIAALLAVWDVPRQLHSHLRGALNAGAGVEEVERAVEVACDLLDPSRAARVRALWQEVRQRSESARGEPIDNG